MHLNEEECAGGMVQSMQRNYAAAKGVQIKLTMEECVKSTGRNAAHTHVAVKDALNKPSKRSVLEAWGESLMRNLLHLISLESSCSSEGCTKQAKKGGVCWRMERHLKRMLCRDGLSSLPTVTRRLCRAVTCFLTAVLDGDASL